MARTLDNFPVTPLPTPEQGTAIPDEGQTPVIPLPTPEQGTAIPDEGQTPVIPLPTPDQGTAIPDEGQTPVIPLPTPDQGTAIPDEGQTPVVPLPNPDQGTAIPDQGQTPVIPLPTPDQGTAIPDQGQTPVYPLPVWPRGATVRFLNACYGYPALQILIGGLRAVSYLGLATVSNYRRVAAGYRTVTVASQDGYVYLQRTVPFAAGSVSTVAVINRAGGLDLVQIPDTCCAPDGAYANFRVSNLAYNSGPMDVLLGDGRVVYADVRFKETTSFRRIRPGDYQFLFAETSLQPMPDYLDIETLDSAFLGTYPFPGIVASAYLSVQRYRSYTVFLINSGSAANAVQAVTVEDR